MVKWVSAFRVSYNKWRRWMQLRGCLQAGLWLKSVGLVQRLVAIWHCSAFIAWTGWTLAMTLSHDDSTVNIVLVLLLLLLLLLIYNYYTHQWVPEVSWWHVLQLYVLIQCHSHQLAHPAFLVHTGSSEVDATLSHPQTYETHRSAICTACHPEHRTIHKHRSVTELLRSTLEVKQLKQLRVK